MSDFQDVESPVATRPEEETLDPETVKVEETDAPGTNTLLILRQEVKSGPGPWKSQEFCFVLRWNPVQGCKGHVTVSLLYR